MKTIVLETEISTGAETRYIPVPCRGNVYSVKVVGESTLVSDKTVIVSRSTTAVNTATAAGETAGNILTGVPDTTNKGLIFDPDSATAANKVLKIVFLADLYGAEGSVTVSIEYDDAAYVAQAASEA